jgi:hypothetical protein
LKTLNYWADIAPLLRGFSHATNLAAAEASVKAIRSLKGNNLMVNSIQEYHA